MSLDDRLGRLEKQAAEQTNPELSARDVAADLFSMGQTLSMPEEARGDREQRRGEIIDRMTADPTLTPAECLEL